MRILVLGAGGIGGYFGGRLVAAGFDVRFLVRPARAEMLARQGLAIASPLGDLRVPVTASSVADTTCDAVLIACKAYDLPAAIDAVAPAVGPSTLVVPLLNGVRQLDLLDAHFGRDRVLGGLCHIGVTVGAEGEIRHLNTLHRLAVGARTPAQAAPAAALHRVLARGGFDAVSSDAILQEMWEKFTFLATYAGMTTLFRAPVGAILAAEDGEALMREMLAECTAIATAEGHPPRPAAMAEMTSALTERGSRGTSSMYRDMAQGARTEHQHVLGDMLTRGRAADLPTPLLRIAFANMQAYEAIPREPAAA